jgi:hypothetical protein
MILLDVFRVYEENIYESQFLRRKLRTFCSSLTYEHNGSAGDLAASLYLSSRG